MTLGRATYEPGWEWSEHIGRALGQKSCNVEHIGIVIQGRAIAAMNDGTVVELRAGDIFYIPPGHGSRVIGDEPYVSLHLIGAEGIHQVDCSSAICLLESQSRPIVRARPEWVET